MKSPTGQKERFFNKVVSVVLAILLVLSVFTKLGIERDGDRTSDRGVRSER